jgi:NAD(P)-dependent dehydrogenase (short-subunit alcohol dehydrogenase family)
VIAWARYPYDGTTVLVTGGGSGIGRAIAQAYLEQGARVLVTARRAQPLQETVTGFPADRAAVLAADMVTATRLTQERLDNPAFWAALRDRIALDRAAEPADVARAALFLTSPDAADITGVVPPVDGGTTASVGTPRPVPG